MAAKKPDDLQEQTNPVPLVNEKHDETAPGGRYVVNGKVVDAEGKPIAGYSVVNGEAVKDKPAAKEAKNE